MYSNSNNFGSSSFGMGSQNQGFQKSYQPVGNVQSFYGQNAIQGNQGYGQQQPSQSFHTANYRGNQAGHDNYLRSDSQTPAQQQGFQGGYSSYGNSNANTGMNTSSQFGFSQSPYNFRSSNQMSSQAGNQQYNQASPEAFHTANYRGNQIGHDSYLRSDSQTPAQQQMGGFQGGYNTQGFQAQQGFQQGSQQGSQQGYNTGINNNAQQFGFNSAY
ncbi:hypothetical protein [Paenibacillus eucommiae]|uniref:Prion-like-(Q/N-rich)-domain-bearing protein n=1 Tax=Paenibacillus eucommiae TaxID=1355755 RepID=A0ABS4JB80_9BACL|nr:hypothetical protein [Paenibacillus eucommiae]MBP1996496.1 hypothetical protein [Paenibacillus eucommiae]